MKSLLAAVSIISIAFGYIIAKASSSSSEETQSAASIETRYDRSKSRETRTRDNGDNAMLDSILGGRSLSDISAADLAAIIIKLSEYDSNTDRFTRAKQIYQLQLLLAKLSATKLADIATALSSDPHMKGSSRLMMEIVSTLTRKDPALVMDWISAQEDSSGYYRFVISTIAESDPLKASSLLNTAVTDGKIDESQQLNATFDSGSSAAKIGADSFFSYLDSVPKKFHNYLISRSLSNIPENDRIRFLDLFHQRLQGGRSIELDMDHLFSQAITKNNSAEAMQWLNKLPDNEVSNACRTEAAQSLYENGDKETAAKWMKEAIAAAPGREKEIIQRAIHELRSNNPESVSFLANLLPEGIKFQAEDMDYSRIDDCHEIPDLAGALSDANEKSIFIANSLNKVREKFTDGSTSPMNSNDFEILSREIAAMGFTGQNAARVNEAITAAKNQLSLKN